MQVSLIRNLALTAAGNGAIAGKDVRFFWPKQNIFRFSKECVFLDAAHILIAADPNAWLTQVKTSCRGLWLHYADSKKWLDDRLTVGFVGGGPRWIIEAVRDGGSDLWEGGDSLGDRKASDGKIWNSGYMRIATGWSEPLPAQRPPRETMQALDSTLAQIETFARDEKIDNFADNFRDARNFLKNAHASGLDRDELLAFADFSVEAKQLWAAVGSAWVFGGMGSWNDMSFDGAKNELYDKLSAALFAQLNEAIAAVANSTYAAR